MFQLIASAEIKVFVAQKNYLLFRKTLSNFKVCNQTFPVPRERERETEYVDRMFVCVCEREREREREEERERESWDI